MKSKLKFRYVDEGKVGLEEIQAAVQHCRKLKKHFNATMGTMATKREQHTHIPMSFWKLLEEMLTDEKIK